MLGIYRTEQYQRQHDAGQQGNQREGLEIKKFHQVLVTMAANSVARVAEFKLVNPFHFGQSFAHVGQTHAGIPGYFYESGDFDGYGTLLGPYPLAIGNRA